jgi:RNA polymerase sigma factor (sigma-70 family)
MSVSALSSALATAARSAGATPASATDGELLRRFVRTRDEGAFGDLVRRLGGLVFGVCRRVSGDEHLAEDAFQAAFVVLARRAGDVRPAEAVRAWMYGVAVRTAREARTVSARRRARETPVPAVPDRAGETTEPADADTIRMLDEEIAGLPEHLRAALLLCELEGVGRKRASERLGVPEGTLSSRLAKARKLLADRLRKRGVTAPAVGLGVLAQVALPPRLVAQTSALLGAAAPLPAAVASLSNGVLRTMLLHKLTLGTACALLLAVACVAAWTALPPATATEPPPAPAGGALKRVPAEDRQPAAPKPAKPGRLIVFKETKFVFLTPDGKEETAFEHAHPDERVILTQPALSPDGKRVAFIVNENPPTDNEGNRKRHLYLRDTDGKTDGVKVAINPGTMFWDTDGKSLIVTEYVPSDEAIKSGFPVWRVNAATKEKTKLDLPKLCVPFSLTADGKTFAAALFDAEAQKVYVALITRDGKSVTKLAEVRTEGPDPHVSGDGTKVLFLDYDSTDKPEKGVQPLRRLFVYDVKAKTRVRLEETPDNGLILGYCWSPDGKRIAYTWKQVHPGVPLAVNTENMNDPKLNTETESHLIVCDPNGKNAKTLMSEKAPSAPTITIGTFDWR